MARAALRHSVTIISTSTGEPLDTMHGLQSVMAVQEAERYRAGGFIVHVKPPIPPPVLQRYGRPWPS